MPGFTHASASLPHTQNRYAVRRLSQEGLIEEDAGSILPGATPATLSHCHTEPWLVQRVRQRHGRGWAVRGHPCIRWGLGAI